MNSGGRSTSGSLRTDSNKEPDSSQYSSASSRPMRTQSRRTMNRIAKSTLGAISLGIAWLLCTAGALSAAELHVDQVDLREVQQAYAPASHASEASGGGLLRVGRKTFPTGFGTS